MTTDLELTAAHLLWHQGMLVVYKGHSVPVKGRVALVYKDVGGVFVAVVVTSRTHPLYAANTELIYRWDDLKLHPRSRRLRTHQ